MTRSHAFSRAFRQLRVITLSFDWLTELSVSFAIGWSYLHWFWIISTHLKTALLSMEVQIIFSHIHLCSMPHSVKGKEIIFSDVKLIPEVLKPGLEITTTGPLFNKKTASNELN